MNWKVSSAVAALVLAAAPFASATTININFEEFAYGASVKDYYNHGMDSNNRASGAYYGVTFSGGTIRNTPSGAYLAGGTTLTIDSNAIRSLLKTDKYYVTFNAGREDIDGGPTGVSYSDGYTDSIWVGGNGLPYCPGGVYPCANPFAGAMGGYFTYEGSPDTYVTEIRFSTNRLDNVAFHSLGPNESPIRPPSSAGGYDARDIPEPASLALFGLGAAALLARRRRIKNTL